MSVQENASVTFGDNFCNTAEGKIVCKKNIIFGDNVLTSWETLIMDTDWHSMQDTQSGEVCPSTEEIIIGSNVWICTRSIVLKGCFIPNGCIVEANTLCAKKFIEENTVIVGNPADVRKRKVTLYRQY